MTADCSSDQLWWAIDEISIDINDIRLRITEFFLFTFIIFFFPIFDSEKILNSKNFYIIYQQNREINTKKIDDKHEFCFVDLHNILHYYLEIISFFSLVSLIAIVRFFLFVILFYVEIWFIQKSCISSRKR